MPQDNINYSRSVVDLVLTQPWERLSIENLVGCCRVVSMDQYIKSECFSQQNNRAFRVIISIESITDDELIKYNANRSRENAD